MEGVAVEEEFGSQTGWHFPSDEDVARILVLTIVALLYITPFVRFPRMSFYKMGLLWKAFQYRLFGKDMKWAPPGDVDPVIAAAAANGEQPRRKRLIFIRHGESTWNDTFNRSLNPLKFVPRLLHALFVEFTLFFTGMRDSWFYDAALSDEGREQAAALAHALASLDQRDPDVRALLGLDDSLVLSSPLRRCLSTAAVALTRSLAPVGKRTIKILPALQEISCNPDTLAITPPLTQPSPSWIDTDVKEYPIAQVYASCDVAEFTQHKPVKGSGITRLQNFCDWLFSPKGGADCNTFVVSGHSFWFRFFFKTYLPAKSSHPAKQLKISNGGVVTLDLCCSATGKYWIDEASIKKLFGELVK